MTNRNGRSAEEEILSKIPGFNDGNDDTNDVGNADTNNDGGGEASDDNDTQANDGTQSVRSNDRDSNSSEPASQGGGQNGQRQTQQGNKAPAKPVIDPKTGKPVTQQQQQPKYADPTQPQGQLRTDSKGNLINAKGEIVARSGQERRLFDKARGLEHTVSLRDRELTAHKTQIEKLTRELADAKVLNGQPAAMGLTNPEAYIGLQLVQKYKSDPAEFIKFVVAKMTEAGHDVDKLMGGKGTFAPSAQTLVEVVRHEIAGALQPRTQQPTQEQIAEADAEEEYERFMSVHPDAHIHEDALSRLLQADESLSLETAYYKLQNWAIKNAFDWNLPLGPQIEAKAKGGKQQQNGNGNGNGNNGQRRPMPNGRAANAGTVQPQQQQFSHASSWDEIINSSIAENFQR